MPVPKIPADIRSAIVAGASVMQNARKPHWSIWRDMARVYLPYTHPWLMNAQQNEKLQLNSQYITSAGLSALRTQSAGLMNGITSPTRPWFSLGIGPDTSKLSLASRQWLEICNSIMRNILARSNFYNVISMGYFDLGLFGIAGMKIFEDKDRVINVQRFNIGEFYVDYDYTGKLRRYDRICMMTLSDLKQQFGEENLPAAVREQLKNPASWNSKRTVNHAVWRKGTFEPLRHPSDRFEWQEIYWMDSHDDPTTDVLSIAGFRDQPAMFPRWSAEIGYSASPAMDAYADMLELGQLILSKGTGLAKMIDPPMLIDASLRNERKSMMPGGYAYIPNLRDAVGARPAYQLNIPFSELRSDIRDLRVSIAEIFNNDLFKMISQLDTVRSATEIDARKEEKLVLLSHFLERFENEQLDPSISRTFSIALNQGLFPDPPPEILNIDLRPQYTSILATAQRAIATVPLERLLQMVGQVSAVDQTVLDIVNFDQLIYTYGADIGANPTVLRDAEQLRERRSAREQQLAALEASATAATAIKGARELSQTDVGGGANALQRLLS